MDETATALAKRLADSPQWEWMAGILPRRWAPGMDDHLQVEARVLDRGPTRPLRGECVPDLDDPATCGCIESAILAWIQPDWCLDVSANHDVACVYVRTGKKLLGTWDGRSKGEALAKAWLDTCGKEPTHVSN